MRYAWILTRDGKISIEGGQFVALFLKKPTFEDIDKILEHPEASTEMIKNKACWSDLEYYTLKSVKITKN